MLRDDREPNDVFDSCFFRDPENILRSWGSVLSYPAGVEIFQQDTPSELVYLIERGIVKLTKAESSGRQLIVGIRRRNWLIAAPSVLLEKPYSTTATTLTRCHLRGISANDFLNMVKTNAQFSFQILRILSQEILNQVNKLVSMGCMSAKERLECFLCEMIYEHEPVEFKKPIQLQMAIKHHELAEIIAITPEYLCRLLKKMEQQDIIRREKHALKIIDPERLLRVAHI